MAESFSLERLNALEKYHQGGIGRTKRWRAIPVSVNTNLHLDK